MSKSLLEMTAAIVAAHLGHTTVPVGEIRALVTQVHSTLAALAGGGEASSLPTERPQPAVPIKKSVLPDYIICLEDGKRLKMLKRHLKSSYNLSPEQYRERWGLPADYPMVAPKYAEQRSRLAKQIGLGKTSRKKRR